MLSARAEQRKFTLLSAIFGLILGTYWSLRPIKDAVFFTMVGNAYQPKAKIISLFVVGALVLIYSKLVDRFPRHKLLYGFAIFYAVATAIFAFFIWHPTCGLENAVVSSDRYLGWAWYMFVESFGSIMIVLFWSFVSDITEVETAKSRYFMVTLGGQTGGFIAPLIALYIARSYGTVATLIIPIVALFSLVLLVAYYMKTTPKNAMPEHVGGSVKKAPLEGKPKAGFLEGLRLLLTRPYLLGIFTLVAFFEIVLTIIEYHFKVLASTIHTGDALTHYLYIYALWTNGVAVVCLAFGAEQIGRRLGLSRTLLLLPALIACAVLAFYFYPVLPLALVIMVSCKGLNYALIQPSKEQLYIPTTVESKYKAKAWIDMFGLRWAKGAGSWINDFRTGDNMELFMLFTTLISMGLIGIWVIAAILVGRIHAKAVKEERLVC